MSKTFTFKGPKVVAGMKVIIELNNPHADASNKDLPKKISLGSYVEELIDDETMLIQMPTYKSYNFPLPKDQSIRTYFFAGIRMFVLDIIFIENVRQGGLHFAKVKRTSELTPFQRRDCFRLEKALPLMIQRIKLDKDGQPIEPTETRLIDISDGGILFASNDDYETGERIFATVELNYHTLETLEAEVIRREQTYGAGVYKYNYSIQFHHTDQRQKDRLYKYIVDQQREILNIQMRDFA